MNLRKSQYRKLFTISDCQDGVSAIQKEALERAWKNRDFEIELYWKRATYFWAFIGATFAGYFIVLNNPKDVSANYPELVLAIMGFIFSLAWYLVNRGSKKWQENWENHIDMLEDEITGPIYKTVLNRNAPSVSRVNMTVSLFVTLLWGFFIFHYFFEYCIGFPHKDLVNILILIVILIFSGLRLLDFGDKLGFRKDRDQFSFKLRKVRYKND